MREIVNNMKFCRSHMYIPPSPGKSLLKYFTIIQSSVPAFTSRYHIPIRVSSSPLCCTQQRRSAAWATFLIFSAHLLHCLSSLFSSFLQQNAAAPFSSPKMGNSSSPCHHPPSFLLLPSRGSCMLHYTPLFKKAQNGSRTFCRPNRLTRCS